MEGVTMRTTLWKQTRPPWGGHEGEEWKRQVEYHLYGPRQMQDALLKAWGYPRYRRKDQRKKPLRDRMQRNSLRARMRELQVLNLRLEGLSFRQIGQRLGVSQVAAWRRYWYVMRESAQEDNHRQSCLRIIHDQVEAWEDARTTRAGKNLPNHNG